MSQCSKHIFNLLNYSYKKKTADDPCFIEFISCLVVIQGSYKWCSSGVAIDAKRKISIYHRYYFVFSKIFPWQINRIFFILLPQHLTQCQHCAADTLRAGAQRCAGLHAFQILAEGSTALLLKVLQQFLGNTGRTLSPQTINTGQNTLQNESPKSNSAIVPHKRITSVFLHRRFRVVALSIP